MRRVNARRIAIFGVRIIRMGSYTLMRVSVTV
jgi:hypothetical protein